MRLLKVTSTASAVLSTALGLSLLATAALAADSSNSLPNLSTATNQPATTGSASAKPTEASNSGSQSNVKTTAVITNTGSVATEITQSAPSITGGATATDRPAITGLPKLSGQFSYPPATVPPTQNAPYMQVSKLPEGTVFIAVGSFLALLAVAVLMWRALVAWLLHRSVKRAAIHHDMADTKAQFRTPAAPTFKYADLDSSQSLSNLSSIGKVGKKGRPASNAGPPPLASQSLFFSPTAGAAGAGAHAHTHTGSLSHAGNRGSNYLPAGYYAAGAAIPGGGNGVLHHNTASRESITLSNLRPQSQGYTRARSQGPTPPDSPGFPSIPGHRMNPSSSTLDLNNPRTTAPRAPSAYLEDLFNESGAPPGHYSGGGRS